MVWGDYDRTTLIYDAVHFPDAGIVRLYLPRLLNFSCILHTARYQVDGAVARPSRHLKHRRFETIDLRVGRVSPHVLTIGTDVAGNLQTSINRQTEEAFRGRRVIYTLLKNERFEWIRDWLTFHHEVHGADAVLIADNGSTNYSSEELRLFLESVPGYVMRQVLSVPLPWGPRGPQAGVDDGKYLQTALLNLVRDRFLSSALAVLNLDVDELLLRQGSRTIFERVQRWGLVTFPGEWRYPSEAAAPPLHKDHLYRDPGDKPCATKYCFRPNSRLGRMCLSVHGLERLNRRLFSGQKEFMFAHCRSISTSWKYDRSKTASPGMRIDPRTAAALESVFGKMSQSGSR
jgi:hypothetical protein